MHISDYFKPPISGKNRMSQLLFLIDGILINGAYVFTTGVILSGYVIHLGGQDFLVALLNNSVNYSTIMSLFSFVIFERLSSRKHLLLKFNLLSRMLICLTIVLPLVTGNRILILSLLSVMVISSDVIWGIYRVGWMVWVMNIAPEDSKTEYIYFRMFLVRIFMSIMTITAGFILDYFDKGYTGFLICFSTSFALSLMDILVLRKIDETGYNTGYGDRLSIKASLQPFKLKEYRNFLIFIFFFYLCTTMASSFTPIYLIKYLRLDYRFISLINVISLITMIISNQFWVRVEGRRGFRFVLGMTSFFIACELLILSFVNRDTYYLLFLSTVISGIGLGGFGVSTFTYRYELMPDMGRTIFEGWFYCIYGLGMLIAPFTGKVLIDIIPDFSVFLFRNSKMQLLYLSAFILSFIVVFLSFIRPSFKSHAEYL